MSAPHDERAQPDTPREGRASGRPPLFGCVGLLCILALPALLYLPVEVLALPRWLTPLPPLVGVGLAAVGVWLVALVPPATRPHSSDPLRPLTGGGRVPIHEQPATAANRTGMVVAVLLVLLSAGGYVLVSVAPGQWSTLAGTLLTTGTGALLVAYALLAGLRRLPVPAWRWVRMPVSAGLATQSMPFLLLGAVALVWAQIAAFEAGYVWAVLGVGILILCGALAGPIGQRLASHGADH